MIKRGRKSSADVLSMGLVGGSRLPVPEHLTEAQAAEWRTFVDSMPDDYFKACDAPLLAAYCVAIGFYKEAAAELAANGVSCVDDKGRRYVNPAHSVMNSTAYSMAQLAGKLRLCPNARWSEKTAARKADSQDGQPARPWEQAAA